MAEYGLVGKFTAHPGERSALVEALLEAAEILRGTPGCRLWHVQESVGEPDEVWIMEAWRSADDHDASLAIPAIRAIIGRAMPLIAAPPLSVETRPRGGVGP